MTLPRAIQYVVFHALYLSGYIRSAINIRLMTSERNISFLIGRFYIIKRLDIIFHL